jgi:hypothetical protein
MAAVREVAIAGFPAIRKELMTVAIIGLILLAAAGVLTAAVVTSNTGAVETDLWNLTVSNLSLGVVFVAGMLTTVVAVAGILLLTAGVRRSQRLRQERRVLRRENQRLSRQAETGVDTDETPTTTDPAADQPSESPRRNLFAPRRPVNTGARTDSDGRHAEPADRVVARDSSEATTEPTSRSS